MTETVETRLKRLRMRSWRRGMREVDLLLGPFADAELGAVSARTLDLYETLLSENDQDVYEWLSRRAAPERHDEILGLIAEFHRID